MPKPFMPRMGYSIAVPTFPARPATRRSRQASKATGHQAAIAGGLAHFTGLPHIALDGDAAVVTSYLQILRRINPAKPIEVPNHGASRGYHIHRVVTNRWELARGADGWKIKRRTLRLVDGSEPSREILRGALGALA